MLELKNISKFYKVAGKEFTALDDISIKFRNNEFVSILGPSGSGKTTMLNIIGGLDQYSKGDLLIKGKSTKDFEERDWDAYRNHSVGFVFQSYNLIQHQTILSNVELSLTLSGVDKKTRREKAINALTKVGLKDHINKKPNQLSGGQMQRVAIARALINDPEILLADEPTGALDSGTSVIIMDLLKEIAQDRLVVMVTHNPELAEKYSTRIVKLRDGQIVDDSDPYEKDLEEKGQLKLNRTSMSFWTALNLSFNNLLTKKARTLLTAFAGSIGIIGIALILSLSTGAKDYIDKVQEDTLTVYPISIEAETIDLTALMDAEFDKTQGKKDKITTQPILEPMLESISAFSGTTENNLNSFKDHIEENQEEINQLTNAIDYHYDIHVNIYDEIDGDIVSLNPFDYIEYPNRVDTGRALEATGIWEELIGNRELLESQYDIVAGKWPENYNEVVLFVNNENQISDLMVYQLGLKDPREIEDMQVDIANDEDIEVENVELDFNDILGKKYKFIPTTEFYERYDDTWVKNTSEDNLRDLYEGAQEIKIVGIVKPDENAIVGENLIKLAYTNDLANYIIQETNDSEIGREQLENQDIDVFTNKPFLKAGEEIEPANIEDLPEEIQAYVMTLPPEEQEEALLSYASSSQSSLDTNMDILGLVDIESPAVINIYANTFESKDLIDDFISDYNAMQDNSSDEIVYTDFVGLLMSSITIIIDIITYLLIGFVSISLIVPL